MIIFVDLEHPRLQTSHPDLWKMGLSRRLKVKYRLEALSGEPCLIVRYSDMTPERVGHVDPRAVLISGCITDFEHYDPAHLGMLRDYIRTTKRPVLGFCAGHQQMAQAFGARIGAIGALEPGQVDPYANDPPEFGAGMKAEHGFMPVEICRPDHPMMAGLPSTGSFLEAHYWEVKDVPRGFEVLARTDLTPIQAIAHREKPIVGTQFHPEFYSEDHPDGRRLIANFCSAYL